MSFKEYFDSSGKNEEEVAQELGVIPYTVTRYLTGERRPNDKMKIKIFIVSKGKVRPDDWFNLEEIRKENKF